MSSSSSVDRFDGVGMAQSAPTVVVVGAGFSGAAVAVQLVRQASTALRVVLVNGPLLKARDWEAVAVPELRVHAQRLATRLLTALNSQTRTDR